MNIRIHGSYFYLGSSQARHCELVLDEQGQLSIPELKLYFGAARDCQLSAPLGSGPRFVDFSDGSRFETSDHGGIAHLQKHIGNIGLELMIDALERNWRWVFFSVLILVLVTVFFVRFGIPSIADWAAENSPPIIQQELARQSMQELDEGFFQPSEISTQEQQQISKAFQQLQGAENLSLYFRDSWIGANALAIPGGAVVVTDDLVKLANNHEQILAVLAHEAGHQQLKHGLKRLYRGLGISVLIVAFTSDLNAITQLILAAPAFLLQMDYSREFERQADEYALQEMDRLNISRQSFAEILRKLEASYQHKDADENSAGSDQKLDNSKKFIRYLSSHPATDERIERILAP